jgi:hypothetical protein
MANSVTLDLRARVLDANAATILDWYASQVAAISAAAPTSFRSSRISAVTSAGTALAVSAFTTLTDLIIINRDSTNFVTLTCTEIGTDAITVKIRAGKACWIPGIDPTATTKLVADTAACLCDVFSIGT